MLTGTAVIALLIAAGYSLGGRPAEVSNSLTPGSSVHPGSLEAGNSFSSQASDTVGGGSNAIDLRSQLAWQAQLKEVARSWAKENCRWAWEHDRVMFPSADADPTSIVKSDLAAVSVEYQTSGPKLIEIGRAHV